MKLLDEIIELAVDDGVRLPVILRKFLVVATKLKNDRLKAWVLGELNGYEDREALPPYRIVPVHAKGFFLGPFGSQLHDQPLASGVLDEDHRLWATTTYLQQGIAAYEGVQKDTAPARQYWPGDLVVRYQTKFMQGWVLNRAWQELPMSGLVELVDSVRNRLLGFALELQQEIGDAEDPLNEITPERVSQAVTTFIFGGNNVVAGNVAGDINQVSEVSVTQGDFASLARVLEQVGVPSDELSALEKAIAEDSEAGEATGLGARTSEWLGKAVTYVGKGGAQILGAVAKATLMKAVMAYFGLDSTGT